jgi:hypothetical protein
MLAIHTKSAIWLFSIRGNPVMEQAGHGEANRILNEYAGRRISIRLVKRPLFGISVHWLARVLPSVAAYGLG